ncbi:aminoglycoside phosphotransferase [Rhodanobacter sp. B05]|uniref:phosphotransferase enzyme family protein n=1 Tax=Rhodanobacter sp. B05 TaxID=1945859 RepID=UPI000986046D|nr:phosphotransferase [Rhodanobacter sp. B05]OOG55063.1 aminoglycoside phosphotransferase [Rhodanobacter sp. B05]
MNPDHLVHGLAGDEIAPDWPALTPSELESLLWRYSQPGPPLRIAWHSPRPLSAACLVETRQGEFFVKRHHRRVRSAATLGEEHRFMAHLRDHGVPIPVVLQDVDGASVVALGDWVYEVHQRAAGIDLYRETVSWQPLTSRAHARSAGRMLAALHDASTGYDAAQRDTHILVARSELIAAPDPVASLRAQLPQRPGLADYLRQRDWQDDLAALLAPWHGKVQPRLTREPRLWTHGDWHVSNLCWSDPGDGASIASVLDFGLAAANCALFDLATSIERNAIAWLALDTGDAAAHPDIACALIEDYRRIRPLEGDDIRLLADLLPLVHVDFALSEVEYFHAITHSSESADVAYDTFLRGHAGWFLTPAGQTMLQAIRDCA